MPTIFYAFIFVAKIEVVKCPKDPREWKQTFEIYPVGINEKVLVNLEMMCQCDCEKPGNPVSNQLMELILKYYIQLFADAKKDFHAFLCFEIRDTLKMPHSARTMEPTNVGFANVLRTFLVANVNVMQKI